VTYSNLDATPYTYQGEGIDFALLHKYVIIGDEMGLGKSLQGIGVSSEVSTKTLVVSPSYLKLNWDAEFQKFCSSKTVFWYKKKTDRFKSTGKPEVRIINYEMLQHMEHLFQWADTVIVDEAHYLKNMEAKRTDCFHFYIEKYKPDYLLLLSGTPIKNNLDEFYSLLVLCSYCPDNSNGKNIRKMYPNIWAFRNHFMKNRPINIRGRKINKYYGHKNIDELKTYLKHKYIRRLAKNVLELPDMVSKMVKIKDIDQPELEEMWEAFESGRPANFSSAKALSAELKAPYTAKYCADMLEQGIPVIIFSDHIKPCEIISKALSKYGVEIIQGSTPVEERHRIVKDFQEGRISGVVSTIGAGSTGITLTRAHNMVFNDLSWVPGDNAQARKRIHRIGQEEKCFIHYMIASSIDARIVKSVTTKKKTIGAVL